MPALNSLKLEDGRRGLVRFVEANRPQGSVRNSITIIFDGKEDIWGSESSGEVRVLFSKGETADDLIKRMVSAGGLPGETILVTDDRDLGYYCKAYGVVLWSVAQFLEQARKTGKVLKTGVRDQGGRRDAAEGKDIPSRTANQINAELSRLWLK